MSDPEYAEILRIAVTSRNVRIAIDDFGTGNSSLVHLNRFPMHFLKIDRTFVKDLPKSAKDAAICNVVLRLVNHLNLSTVTEGVESEQRLLILAAQGRSSIQGFHTGRRLMPETVIQMLKSRALPEFPPTLCLLIDLAISRALSLCAIWSQTACGPAILAAIAPNPKALDWLATWSWRHCWSRRLS